MKRIPAHDRERTLLFDEHLKLLKQVRIRRIAHQRAYEYIAAWDVAPSQHRILDKRKDIQWVNIRPLRWIRSILLCVTRWHPFSS